jgi:hypothetical protein
MNLEQFINLINENTRTFIPFFVFLNFGLLIGLIIFNFKEIKSFFKKINKNTWIIFFIIILLASFIRIFISPHATMMFEDEGWYMDTAKHIMEMNGDYFISASYKSIGWPFLISLSFLVFGRDNLVAHFASSFLGILTVFNIFCLSLILFKKEKIALWSSFVFSLVPVHIAWSGSVETAVPSVFFITLALFFSLLYFKRRTNSLFFLSLAAIGFASQVRMENYLLFPFFFGFLLFKKDFFRKDFLLKTFLLIIIALIVFPNFANNFQHYFFANWNTVDAGVYSQNWGTSNFINNLSDYGNHLFDRTYHPPIFTVFLILGLIFAFIKRKKAFGFLMIWFLIFFLMYFCSWSALSPKSRLFLNFYPVTAIFASYGIYFFLKSIKFEKVLTVVLIILVLISFSFSIRKEIRKINFLEQGKAEVEIIHLAVNNLPKDCLIVSNLPIMFSGVIDNNFITSGDFLKKDFKYFEEEKCILFFKDYTCDPRMDFSPEWQRNYQLIKKNYKLISYLADPKSEKKVLMEASLSPSLTSLKQNREVPKNFGFYEIKL